MTHQEFEALCVRISQARGPEELFPAGNGTADERRRRIDEAHRQLLSALEAGGRLGEGAWQAASIMKGRLGELRDLALASLEASGGPYRQAAPGEPASSLIRASRGAYRVDRALARGDLAVVYEGLCVDGEAAGEAVVVKIAADAGDNDLLRDEAAALGVLQAAGGAQTKHLPRLLDQVMTPDGRGGNVLARVEGHDLAAVRERYPEGVPAEHVIWMVKRLLSVLGYAHSLNVLHGNVEPTHVVVRARDHNVTLIDWAYALVDPARSGRTFKAENPGWSAPEIAERRPPLPSADLYSTGKCMAFLLGARAGEEAMPDGVDERLRRFVQHLTRPSAIQRAQDAWQAFEELEQIRRGMFGAHRFVEFEM